jgi:hypothetical protein
MWEFDDLLDEVDAIYNVDAKPGQPKAKPKPEPAQDPPKNAKKENTPQKPASPKINPPKSGPKRDMPGSEFDDWDSPTKG